MINKIHDNIFNDPKVEVRKSISTERVVNILHTYLCSRKLCAKWVPRLLTIDQKRIRVSTTRQNLAYFNRNLKEFFCQFVMMDDTLIDHDTPKSHEGSKQWIKPGESAPKLPKTQQSTGKVMAYYAALFDHCEIKSNFDKKVNSSFYHGNIKHASISMYFKSAIKI